MRKSKHSQDTQDGNKNSDNTNEKHHPLTPYIPLISALIAALGFITVAIINRSAAYVPMQFTQTAEVRLTSMAIVTQEYLKQLTNTPVATPTHTWTETATPTTTIQPVLVFYVRADQAAVYGTNDQSTNPIQIISRGTSVEVLDASDSIWLHVTFIKDRTRITGFVLREQFTLDFVPMETLTATPTP